MIPLSALFTAISVAAAVALHRAGQSGWAFVFAVAAGWWGNEALHGGRGWLYDWRAARKGGR